MHSETLQAETNFKFHGTKYVYGNQYK